jgi:hypothetical protein
MDLRVMDVLLLRSFNLLKVRIVDALALLAILAIPITRLVRRCMSDLCVRATPPAATTGLGSKSQREAIEVAVVSISKFQWML